VTINIAISTYEGVVLGCDSLSSRTALAVMPFSNGDSFAKDAAGNDIIDAQGNKVFSVSELRHVVTDVFTGAQKMFLIFEDDECSGQLIPDSILSFSSAATGDTPPLNVCGRCSL
jgi:hypothetical protein